MSVSTVARKDLTSVRRSRGLWAAATLLALLLAVVAYGLEPHRSSDAAAVQRVYGTLTMGFAVLLPLVALAASYLSIAGERNSGGLKFLLCVPNTRRDVFLGKLASRLVVVAGAVAFMFAATATVAATRHGALPLGTVGGLFLVSLAYAATFVCVAVALSGAIASRSRAIAAAVGSYFVLVVLYVVPVIRVADIVRWLHHTMLGFERNPNLYDAVSYTSPFVAYRKAANLALPEEVHTVVFHRSTRDPELPGYLGDEMSLVVLAAWLVVPPVLGYLRFAAADLE